MNALLEAALRYGKRTVPLRPRSKLPAIDDWPNWDATPDNIRAWWTQNPRANVGVRLGHGLVAIDVDPRAGAEDVLSDLEHEHGELPPTLTVLSGGDDRGRHLYFTAPADIATFTVGAGLQIRSHAKSTSNPQQCVAPPSVHPDTGRTYQFADNLGLGEVQIAALPRWLCEHHRDTEHKVLPAEDWVRLLRGPLAPGDRHPTLLRLTAHLLGKNVDPLVALEIVAAYNDARCKPPKPYDEVVDLVDWVCGRELAARRTVVET